MDCYYANYTEKLHKVKHVQILLVITPTRKRDQVLVL